MDINNETYDKVKDINIATEMRNSFLDYSMSVIVSRALPDVRDGLKPVHRRILYAMNDLGMHADKPYKKSARIVGDVIGKYHPHGDSAIYETMVRMAQDFSYREMLVDGHGNFGSIDGDSAAAMRYTEARMSKISMEMLRDINKDTVDFVDNYDGTEREPSVLPAKFPNLLVNGATGIAVGMATNIPPHNLSEVIDGVIALSHNKDLTPRELTEYIKGPDFPTSAMILGRSGIIKAYETGNGSVIVRALCEVETRKNGKQRIIISEIPYQVNKAKLVLRIAELIKEKKLEGITDLRDESNREGIRVVIEIHKDAQGEVVLNNLYKQTSLQTSFGMNMLALVNGIPKVLNLKEFLFHYLEHQKVVIYRRTQFELNKALARAHILEGLKIALDHIDEIIRIIRGSRDDSESKPQLIERFGLSEIQAQAILEMRLRRLSGLEREKIENELRELQILIAELESILASDERILEIIRMELTDIKNKFGNARRTEITEGDYQNIEDESLIPQEDIIITVTKNGYAKRVSNDMYKSQNRGGKGIKATTTVEDDFVEHLISTNTHHYLLFFTNKGKVYRIKGYQIPEFGRLAKGLPLINLLGIEKDESINSVIAVDNFNKENYFFFVTRKGLVKRTKFNEYESIRANGKKAIGLREEDEVVTVRETEGSSQLIIAASNGKAIRFDEDEIRVMSRQSSGVRGMRIDETEVIIGMEVVNEDQNVLIVTEKGYGKKTGVDAYRIQSRGGKGIKTLNVTDKNGKLVALKMANDDEDIMIITNQGMIIRMNVEQISQSGRTTQGVRLIRLKDSQSVATVALIDALEITEDSDHEEN